MSEIITIPVTTQVPKETKEAIDAVKKILVVLMVEKTGLAGLAAVVPDCIQAIEGYAEMSAEIKSQYLDEALGYMVKELSEPFLGKR